MAFDRTFDSGAAASVPQADMNARFGLADFIGVVRARKNLILRIAALAVGLTALVTFLMPTLYGSAAVVMLEQRRNNFADQSSVLSALPTDPASVQNQIQILTSRDIAERVIANLKLYDDPEFAGGPGLMGAVFGEPDAATQLDAIIDNFLTHLWVTSEGLSTTISITFFSKDPHKAARIANAIADAYIADQIDTKAEAARVTTQWLENRIDQLARQVQAADAAAERYKAENNLNETANGTSLVEQQLAAINTQLVQARADLAQKQATYTRVQQLVRSGDEGEVSQVVASPLIIQLRTQEADLIAQQAQLATKYGARHPKMIAIESQKRDLEAKVRQEVTRIAGSIANDVAVAEANVKSLEASLQQTEAEARDQNMAMVKLKALQASAASTRSMYEAFVTRLRQAQDQDEIALPDARIISRAPVPDRPSSPKRMLIIGASVPAGLLLGLLAALLVERLSGSAPVQRVIDFFRGRPVIGEVPGAVDLRLAEAQAADPWSPFARDMDSLLRRIGRSKVVAVTSAQDGEGATNVAVALARAASRAGMKVAVIDGHLQNQDTARAFGFWAGQAGLVDVLSGKARLSQAFQRDPQSNALVLSGARMAVNPQNVFASRPMAQLVQHLRKSCDLVIVDAPAVFGGTETRALAPLCDATLMVVAEPRPAVSDAIDSLMQARSAPIGIVLSG